MRVEKLGLESGKPRWARGACTVQGGFSRRHRYQGVPNLLWDDDLDDSSMFVAEQIVADEPVRRTRGGSSRSRLASSSERALSRR